MFKTKIIAFGVGILLVLGALFIVASNGDDSATAKEVDGTFLTEMVPHHESAVEMAEIAKTRATHPQIVQLANDIARTQTVEINTLNQIHERLFGGPIGTADHGESSMSPAMMGMEMDPNALKTAKPFDREFIDQMIPHHQGAIRMARTEIRTGEDQEAKDLALMIVDAQAKEIENMNRWRIAWYGAESPSGGVPSLDEMPDESMSMEGMDH